MTRAKTLVIGADSNNVVSLEVTHRAFSRFSRRDVYVGVMELSAVDWLIDVSLQFPVMREPYE